MDIYRWKGTNEWVKILKMRKWGAVQVTVMLWSSIGITLWTVCILRARPLGNKLIARRHIQYLSCFLTRQTLSPANKIYLVQNRQVAQALTRCELGMVQPTDKTKQLGRLVCVSLHILQVSCTMDFNQPTYYMIKAFRRRSARASTEIHNHLT